MGNNHLGSDSVFNFGAKHFRSVKMHHATIGAGTCGLEGMGLKGREFHLIT